MSKSIIYAGNSASQSVVAAGSTVAFNNIVRRYGCNLGVSGGNVTVEGAGYYDVDVNLTITGSAAGTATVQVYKDGVAVPYANATAITTSTSVESVTVPCIIRSTCNCTSTITVIVSGVDCVVSSAGITVEKE